MRDGYYTAEASSFDAQGWKEFLVIYVHNGKIVTVEFNARNSSGFIRSWDMEYMREMKARRGDYPTKYTRGYATALLNRQSPEGVFPLPGGEDLHLSFKLLSEAAIARAKAGNPQTALVALPERGAEGAGPGKAPFAP
jgi:major membrane immunogen (membrane-anchored lipoprotein)